MNLFALLYRHFEKRRGWLLLVLVLILGLAGWLLPRLTIEESISAMLPDGGSRVSRDFQLLQEAPFARKVVINLRADEGISRGLLIAATDRLSAALPEELFHNPTSGPDSAAGHSLYSGLGDYLPALLDGDDLEQLRQRLTAAEIERRLADDLAQLLQPQGVALKNEIRRDPLQFKELGLAKLRYLNPIPGVRLEQGHFISADGRSCLILADTPVQITDAAGAKALMSAFATASAQLPQGVSAELVSGHPYTLANSETIQSDMQRVLLASGIGILLLFGLFLRSLRALAVYLLPLLSMTVALMVTAARFDTLSGITIGFGAVLLGITIDFGLHVYFALRRGDGQGGPDELLRAVSRPVLFGGLTSLTAFGVLLSSDLPGQRQLAVFAMAGIVAALLLALIVLPHFIGKAEQGQRPFKQRMRRHVYDRRPGLRITVLLLWLLIAGFSAWQAQGLAINGELKKLSYLPASLQQTEQRLSENWGNMRGQALLFATGASLDAALEKNEQIWAALQHKGMADQAVSLAPLLPSRQRQLDRVEQWQAFWQEHRANTHDLVRSSGTQYGFSEGAFAPFWQWIAGEVPLLTPDTLRGWGLGRIVDGLLLSDGQSFRLLTLVPDDAALIAELESELGGIDGIALVSQSRFGKELSREIGADFSRFISYAGCVVLLLLILLFRRFPAVLLALLPVLTGLLAMFGFMGWLGLEMNLFNVIASILIIGLGVDYGIFMVCHIQQEEDLASSRAILVSGMTTLVGFGALVLARHPALHSIGLTVLLGISAAVPTAIFVIPAFRPKRL